MNTPGTHREREAGVLTVVLALPCAPAVVGSAAPAVDTLVTRGLAGLVVVGVLTVAARLLARLVRERREDRADAATAAAWRAAHGQHPEHQQQASRHDSARSGVT